MSDNWAKVIVTAIVAGTIRSVSRDIFGTRPKCVKTQDVHVTVGEDPAEAVNEESEET